MFLVVYAYCDTSSTDCLIEIFWFNEANILLIKFHLNLCAHYVEQ